MFYTFILSFYSAWKSYFFLVSPFILHVVLGVYVSQRIFQITMDQMLKSWSLFFWMPACLGIIMQMMKTHHRTNGFGNTQTNREKRVIEKLALLIITYLYPHKALFSIYMFGRDFGHLWNHLLLHAHKRTRLRNGTENKHIKHKIRSASHVVSLAECHDLKWINE